MALALRLRRLPSQEFCYLPARLPARPHVGPWRSPRSKSLVSRCRGEGAWPGGIYLKYTGRDVTERLGGPSGAVLEEQPSHPDEMSSDPCFKARWSLELGFRLAELMRPA